MKLEGLFVTHQMPKWKNFFYIFLSLNSIGHNRLADGPQGNLCSHQFT